VENEYIELQQQLINLKAKSIFVQSHAKPTGEINTFLETNMQTGLLENMAIEIY